MYVDCIVALKHCQKDKFPVCAGILYFFNHFYNNTNLSGLNFCNMKKGVVPHGSNSRQF
jgi:hypothetical protein